MEKRGDGNPGFWLVRGEYSVIQQGRATQEEEQAGFHSAESGIHGQALCGQLGVWIHSWKKKHRHRPGHPWCMGSVGSPT